MAHDDDGLGANPIFVVSERPPDRRLDAQALKEVGAHVLHGHLLSRRALGRDRHAVRVRADADQALERRLFAGDPAVEKCRDRRALMPPLGDRSELAVVIVDDVRRRKPVVRPLDDDERIGVGHRERPQQRGVDQAEDRGIRAAADGERQHDGGRQHRRLPQLAETVPRILHRRLEPLDDADRPRFFRDPPRVAQPQPGGAGIAALGDVHVEMAAQLLFDLGGMAAAADGSREPGPESHDDPPVTSYAGSARPPPRPRATSSDRRRACVALWRSARRTAPGVRPPTAAIRR
jgi:hypothetical protein